MTYSEAVRVIEGKLYSYFLARLEYPSAAISGAYESWTPPARTHESPQERWVAKHSQMLTDAAIIGRVLRSLTPRDRELVRLRYGERWPWDEIGKRLGLRGGAVYQARDRILGVFYGAFRLWDA